MEEKKVAKTKVSGQRPKHHLTIYTALSKDSTITTTIFQLWIFIISLLFCLHLFHKKNSKRMSDVISQKWQMRYDRYLNSLEAFCWRRITLSGLVTTSLRSSSYNTAHQHSTTIIRQSITISHNTKSYNKYEVQFLINWHALPNSFQFKSCSNR